MMAPDFRQVPGIQRRRFGDFVVTALNDGFIVLPPGAVRGITAADSDALYRSAGRRPPCRTAINAYLIQSPDSTVLVDAGCGRFMGPHLGRLPANLHAAGVSPDEIDLILITHMHTDHLGGLLADSQTVAYPRARVMMSAKELEYWSDRRNYDSSPESTRDSFDVVAQVLGAYNGRIDTFDGGVDIVPGIKALPLNGHTPGHTGFEIGNGGNALIIWGDVSHAPEVQMTLPDLTVIFDVDPERAIASRRFIFERAASEDIMIAGMHIPFPGFTRIARSGGAYVSLPQVWQYELLE
jgi:glyoxylase-like metal-dependent hydrolase (beta-lactamase superfamily II)